MYIYKNHIIKMFLVSSSTYNQSDSNNYVGEEMHN